ncbi:unnamed protein product [Dicrocoelium dendriticum]|nr:unnamed protein product [Dicrocoelium dendriticum]
MKIARTVTDPDSDTTRWAGISVRNWLRLLAPMAPAIKTSLRKRLRVCHFRRRRNFVSRSCNMKFRNSRSNTRILPLSDTSADEKLDPVYLVERIIERKSIKGQKFYKVRWQGFPPEADSWEPEQNLSSILDSVASSPQVVHNVDSRADPPSELPSVVTNISESVPTSLSVQLESSLRSENVIGMDRNRPANERSHKRKDVVKSRVAGRYEYVPKHQLVASKTKYFDDVRDGKIDLSSNDLYSRVKTRRRANEGSLLGSKAHPSHNFSSIARRESEHDTNELIRAPSTTHSLSHELHSPMSGDSLNDFQSTTNSIESERLLGNFADPPDSFVGSVTNCSIALCADIVSEPISANPPTCITVDRWTSCVTEPHTAVHCTTEFESTYVQAIPNMVDASVSPSRPLCYSPLLTNDDSAVSSSF